MGRGGIEKGGRDRGRKRVEVQEKRREKENVRREEGTGSPFSYKCTLYKGLGYLNKTLITSVAFLCVCDI